VIGSRPASFALAQVAPTEVVPKDIAVKKLPPSHDDRQRANPDPSAYGPHGHAVFVNATVRF
jgi:hypothetical protein